MPDNVKHNNDGFGPVLEKNGAVTRSVRDWVHSVLSPVLGQGYNSVHTASVSLSPLNLNDFSVAGDTVEAQTQAHDLAEARDLAKANEGLQIAKAQKVFNEAFKKAKYQDKKHQIFRGTGKLTLKVDVVDTPTGMSARFEPEVQGELEVHYGRVYKAIEEKSAAHQGKKLTPGNGKPHAQNGQGFISYAPIQNGPVLAQAAPALGDSNRWRSSTEEKLPVPQMNGYYDQEKIQKALIGHEPILQLIRDPDRWTMMRHRSTRNAETYFRTEISPEEYKGVSNMLSAVLRSDGFELDNERLEGMDGANRGINGQLQKLLVTTYGAPVNKAHSEAHFDNSSPHPIATHLQLTVDQMKMLGIPLAMQRAAVLPTPRDPQLR